MIGHPADSDMCRRPRDASHIAFAGEYLVPEDLEATSISH
jgi:hypothetical protein